MPPKAGTTPKKKEAAKDLGLPVNVGISWVTSNQFPGDQRPGASRDNPVHLSEATDTSASGSHPQKDDNFDNEAKLLGHFSDALREMATSIVDLEDGYFKALHEVIMETERALWDVSRINTHYVSQVVTVMSSWQEAVQTAASHMEGVDTTIYLAGREDARKVTQEYVAAVVKAWEEHDTAHAVEQGAQRQALKDDDHGDPVVRLLGITQQAAHAQCEKAVDAFLSSIEWLRSPVLSGRSHLTMTTTTVITMPAPASAGLIPACQRPHTGTLAELAKQVVLTCSLPYFTGVPSAYQPTPRSHPVAISVRLQTRTRNMAHC